MRVIRLVLHAKTRQPVLVLGEAEGRRCLPVFLRQPQADVIAVGPRDQDDPLLPVAIPIPRASARSSKRRDLNRGTGVFARAVVDGSTRVAVHRATRWPSRCGSGCRSRVSTRSTTGQPVEGPVPRRTDAPPERRSGFAAFDGVTDDFVADR